MKMDSTIRLFWISVVVLVICVCSLPRSAAETEASQKVYREGGAMAVIRSQDCPRWGQSLSWGPLTDSTTVYCSEAILDALGRDISHSHFFCDVDIRFPLRSLQKEATLGILPIFDGYYSNEESQIAWKFIEEYFFLHTYFLFDRLEGDNFDGSFHFKMLKEALVRAIHDIKNRYTATIIVMVDESGEGISEVATGSYYGWLAASHSQSVCELSSRRVGRQVVNIASFMVRVDSQKHIDFSLTSPLGGGRPGRVKRRNQKAAAKKASGGDGDEEEDE